MLSEERAGQLIIERIKKRFVKQHNVRYQIQIVNDKIDKRYNVFFGIVNYYNNGLGQQRSEAQGA